MFFAAAAESSKEPSSSGHARQNVSFLQLGEDDSTAQLEERPWTAELEERPAMRREHYEQEDRRYGRMAETRAFPPHGVARPEGQDDAREASENRDEPRPERRSAYTRYERSPDGWSEPRYERAALRDEDARAAQGGEREPREQPRAPKRDVAFVSVFGFGPDPQRATVYDRDDIGHVELWKDSIERLNMNGVVLHDDVYTPQFVSEQHSPVQFKYMNVRWQGLYTDPKLQNLTTSDWRFIAMHDYLTEHKDELGYVLLTDGHDVAFRTDPFKYMRAVDDALGHGYVFGQEEWRPRIAMSDDTDVTAMTRMVTEWKKCFGTKIPTHYVAGRMPNCGILGGNVSVVLPFLDRMRHWYSKVPRKQRFKMCDMMVYMRTVMHDYQDRFVSGYPFHAKFKNDDPRDIAAIYHKHSIPPERADLPSWRKHEILRQPLALLEDLPSFDGPKAVENR